MPQTKKKSKKKAATKTAARVRIAKSEQESNPETRSEIKEVLRLHRKNVESRYQDVRDKRGRSPLSETLDSPVRQIPLKVQHSMTAEECCELLRGMVHNEPKKFITRNYFRKYSGIKESTWTHFFGKFAEFKRQAGIVPSRGAHRLELDLSRHVSADVYRAVSEERKEYAGKYEKPRRAGRYKLMLVASDFHDRDCDPFALRVFLDTVKRLGGVLDAIVIGGDLFDLPEFGRHTQDPRDWDASGRIRFAHDNILAPLRTAAPRCQIDLIEGNHDARMVRYLADSTPAMRAVLSDLHGFTVAKLFGLDKFEINYIGKADLAAASWSRRDHNKEIERNWKVYYDCFLVHHFPHGKKKQMPGCNGHHHQHRVWAFDSPLFGPYEWHQIGAMHVRDASYTDGERWTNGFLLVHIDTEKRLVNPEYVTISDFAVVGGKYYGRRPSEEVLLSSALPVGA